MVTVKPRRAFFTTDRSLQPEGLNPPRGVAASGFRPLRKIPHCCLPWESGPCRSSSVAVHPLRPATHHNLGRPLPHQLANKVQAHPQAPEGFDHESLCSMVLCGISSAFAKLFLTRGQITHMLLTRPPLSLNGKPPKDRSTCMCYARRQR